MPSLDLLKTLVLNGNWQAINVCSIRKGLENLCTGSYSSINFDGGNLVPLSWEDWILLPIGEADEAINTVRQQVRVPRVIIAKNYRKVPKRRLSLNLKNLRKHYNNTCAYSGAKLSDKEASWDHVVPRSKGGGDSWDNAVLANRDINSLKSDLTAEEFERKHGYKMLYKPSAPKEKLATDDIVNVYGLPEWELFLKKR